MDAQIVQLVNVINHSQTDNDVRDAATQQMLQILTNPESVLVLISLVLNENDPNTRFRYIVYLHRAIEATWENNFVGNPQAENAKQGFLAILQKETIKNHRHAMVAYLSPVFVSEADKWPVLYEFINQIVSQQNPESLEYAMYLATYLIQKLPDEIFAQTIQMYLQMIAAAFTSNNPDAISTAIGLVSVLLVKASDQQVGALSQVFEASLNLFIQAATSTNTNLAADYANKIAFGLKLANSLPIPPDQLLNHLLSAAPNVPPDSLSAFFWPISDLVGNFGRKLRPQLQLLCQTTILAASSCFQGSTLDDEDDMCFILEVIETACVSMHSRSFFQDFLSTFIVDTPAHLAASEIALYRIIPELNESLAQNISTISDLLIKGIDSGVMSVMEVCIDSIFEIGVKLEEHQDEVGNVFISKLTDVLTSGDPNLTIRSLRALTKILMTVDINLELIAPLLERLNALLQAMNDKWYVFDVLAALVFSAGSDISAHAGVLFQPIMAMAHVPEEADPIGKANAIEALGYLIRFAPGIPVAEAVQFLFECGQTMDYDIRSSVQIALANSVITGVATQCPDAFIGYINQCISIEKPVEFDLNEDEVIKAQGQISCLSNTILLIKHLAKFCPQILPQTPVWIDFAISQMDSEDEDLAISASLAALYLVMNMNGLQLPSFLEATIKNFKHPGPAVVGAAFKVFQRFIDHDLPLPDGAINAAIENGLLALSKKLDCQGELIDDDEFDEDEAVDDDALALSMNVYRFFATLATKFPAQFPVAKFIDRRKNTSNPFEQSQYVGVLRQLYTNGPQLFSPIAKRKYVELCVERLAICDFTVIPESILAIKALALSEPQTLEQYYPRIFEYIQTVFESEFDGEMHYFMTVTDTISLVCALISIGKLNPAQFWPIMATRLPVKGDELEADYIYNCLMNSTNFIEPAQVIRILAQTMAFKDDILKEFDMKPETFNRIKAVLGQFLQNTPNSQEILQSALPNEISQMHFTERMGQ